MSFLYYEKYLNVWNILDDQFIKDFLFYICFKWGFYFFQIIVLNKKGSGFFKKEENNIFQRDIEYFCVQNIFGRIDKKTMIVLFLEGKIRDQGINMRKELIFYLYRLRFLKFCVLCIKFFLKISKII